MKNSKREMTCRLEKARKTGVLRRSAAIVIILLLFITMLPVSTFAAENSADSSFMSMNDAPAEFSSTTDPYGYGVGVPFNMAAQNELLLMYSYDLNNGNKPVYQYSGGYYQNSVNDNNISDSKMSNIEMPSVEVLGKRLGGPFETKKGLDVTKAYMFTEAVAFDPTGSGRKDYVAYIGYDPDTEGGRVVVYVMNAETGKCTVAYHAGWAGWIKNEDLEQYEANNFFAITAGRYSSGEIGETFVTYSPLSNGNYTLKEWKVTVNANGDIYINEKGSSKSYLHETYRKAENEQKLANQNTPQTKLGVSLSTGDYNGDRIDDLAVLSYTQIPEDASNLKDQSLEAKLFTPQLTVALGGGRDSILGRTSGVSTREVRESSGSDSDGYPRLLTMTAPSVASGDVNGDGFDEVVVAGWRVNLYKQKTGDYAQYYDFVDGVTVGIYECNGYLDRILYTYYNYANSETSILNTWSNRIKTMLDGKSDGNVLPQFLTECVAMDGASNPEYLFLNGTFCLYNGNEDRIDYKYTPGYFRSEDNACNEHSVDFGFISSAAVGVFDNNKVGREQIIVSVGLKQKDQDDYFYMLGTMGGRDYNDTTDGSGDITSYGKLGKYYTTAFDKGGDDADYTDDDSYLIFEKGDNTDEKLNCLVVAIDIFDDGTVARYNRKDYNYTDPNIIAVLQAPPYFEELGYYGGETTYAITTSYNISNQESKSVSYSVGLSVEMEGPGVKTAISSGYTSGWSASFEQSYGESFTKTFSAEGKNQVVLQRTPVIMYIYDIQDESGEWVTAEQNVAGSLQVLVPCAPVYTQIDIPTYNYFVDKYNAELSAGDDVSRLSRITQDILLNNEGKPSEYATDWDDIDGDQFGSENFSISTSTDGYTSLAFSTETAVTEGTDRTSGFYFNGSVGSGASFLLGSVYAQLEAGTEKGVTYGTYKTEAKATESLGTVYNLAGIDGKNPALLSQFGFNWTFGTWSLRLDSKSSDIPVFGYTVNNVSSAIAAPTGLAVESSDDSGVVLSWTDAGTSYNIYLVEDGTYTKLNGDTPLSSNTYTYTFPTELRPFYSFVVTSVMGEREGINSNKLIYYRQSYGQSAYQIAVGNGFVGTEAEWLDSLVGRTGEPGKNGVGISEVTINEATGGLVIILTDGTSINLGDVTGEDGRDGVGIDGLYINSNGQLIIQLTGSEEKNLGVVVGTNGVDGRETEFRTTETHIQWRYVGEDDTAWRDLTALSTLKGVDGIDGEDAKNIQLTVESGSVMWRLNGDSDWIELIALSEITGEEGEEGQDGREIELRNTTTHIQWRYVGEDDTAWRNLNALETLKGADGSDGTDGRNIQLSVEGGSIMWRLNGDSDWVELIALSEITGANGEDGKDGIDGKDGREIEIRANSTHIRWRYIGEGESAWRNVIALSDIAGVQGPKGDTGETGAAGEKGEKGDTGEAGADGITPHIGENGNWFIGETDTGVAAQVVVRYVDDIRSDDSNVIISSDGDALIRGTKVSVKDISSDIGTVLNEEAITKLKSNLSVIGDGTEILSAFDISLLLDGAEVQPDGMVKINIPVPENAHMYSDLTVIYVSDDGTVTKLKTTLKDNNMLEFETDHFSTYAVAGMLIPGTLSPMYIVLTVLLLLSVAGLAVVVLIMKKKYAAA